MTSGSPPGPPATALAQREPIERGGVTSPVREREAAGVDQPGAEGVEHERVVGVGGVSERDRCFGGGSCGRHHRGSVARSSISRAPRRYRWMSVQRRELTADRAHQAIDRQRRFGGSFGTPLRARSPGLLLAVTVLLLAPAATARARQARIEDVEQSLLHDPSYRVRVGAALVLGRLGKPRSVPVLVRALGDANPAVRASAATSLGQIGDPAARDPLARAQQDPSPMVRRMAEKALHELPEPSRRARRRATGDVRHVRPGVRGQADGRPQPSRRPGAAPAHARRADGRAGARRRRRGLGLRLRRAATSSTASSRTCRSRCTRTASRSPARFSW